MSEELNIIQAIEMPVGTRFNVDDTNCENIVVIKSANDFKNELKEYEIEFLSKKFLCWESSGEKLSQGDYEIGLKFVPIQKPVSFEEAICSNKRIKVVVPKELNYKYRNGITCLLNDDWNNEYKTVENILKMLAEHGKKEVLIKKCKWYIEEE